MDLDKQRKESQDTLRQNKNLQFELTAVKNAQKCTQNDFNIEQIKKDQELLKFYTSFENITLYDNFSQLLEPQFIIARNHLASLNFKRQNCTSLTYDMQLFMTLVYLRLGLLEADLAYRFHVSQSTVSNVLNFWVHFMCKQFEQVPTWPSVDIVQKHMPPVFKDLYPKTRVIIDCTELFIQTPSDYIVQSQTYSQYKSHNTAKGLVAIAPNGYVSFVSDLYGGRTSDKELTSKCGIIDLLEEGDHVMADRGFLIEDVLSAKNITLNMPPFLRSKKQFSVEEDDTTKKIASVRVHVERVIDRIKTFRILKYVFPNGSHTSLNSVWKVCSYLCNFNGLPLLDRKPK